MINDPRTQTDFKLLDGLRADVATARQEGTPKSDLLKALNALEHYLAWATRLDDLFRHEDMVRGYRGNRLARKPSPNSPPHERLAAERQMIVRELRILDA